MITVTIDDKPYEKIPTEVAALLQVVSEERDELKEFVIWMIGCGRRDELLK